MKLHSYTGKEAHSAGRSGKKHEGSGFWLILLPSRCFPLFISDSRKEVFACGRSRSCSQPSLLPEAGHDVRYLSGDIIRVTMRFRPALDTSPEKTHAATHRNCGTGCVDRALLGRQASKFNSSYGLFMK